MSRNDWRSENTYARLTDSTSGYGRAMSFRRASSNISSGSSVPSMWRCSSALGKAAASITAASSHGAADRARGHVDRERVMPGQPIEIILLRELADHLSTAIFVVDPDGAPRLLQRAGGVACSVAASTRPARCRSRSGRRSSSRRTAAASPHARPRSCRSRSRSPSSVPRKAASGSAGSTASGAASTIAAIPLKGQWGDQLGAVAIFWEQQ